MTEYRNRDRLRLSRSSSRARSSRRSSPSSAAGVSTRTAVQILGGDPPACSRRQASSSRRPTWSSRSARRSRPRSTATERWSCRAGCSSTCRGLLPDSEVELEYREDENILQVSCGPAEYRLNTYGAEDFPRLPGGRRRRRRRTVEADALLATLAVGRPRGLARRGAPRADGHPGASSARASWSWPRPTRTGCRTRRRRSRARCRTWRRSSRRVRSRRFAASRPPAARSSSASRRTRCSSGSTGPG